MRGIVGICAFEFVSRGTDVDLEIVVLVIKCQGGMDVDVDVESRRIFWTVKSFLEWLTRVSSPRLSRRLSIQLGRVS